jgi:hypothetical protein
MANKILAVYTEYHHKADVIIGITLHVAVESGPDKFKAYHNKFVNHSYPSEYIITRTAESGQLHDVRKVTDLFPALLLTHKYEE